MTDQPQYPSYPGPEQPAGPPAAGQAPPPPPPGYQPPPPPGYEPQPAYGQVPPAYGLNPPIGPANNSYAGWWSRVGAYLLDSVIGFAVTIVPLVVGAALSFKDLSYDDTTQEFNGDANPLGIALIAFAFVLGLAFGIWNIVIRQGRTGQTLGKKILGIQVVKSDTGEFLGSGTAFLRWLMMAILGGVCFLNYLWPLWDKQKRAWHDMIVGSVVTSK